MLALCLQNLAAANANNVNIYADNVNEERAEEIKFVHQTYFPGASLYFAPTHPPALSGSWNILNSIKHAAESADEVYLVEEDVLVYPDFFRWHESQTTAASCGRVDRYTKKRKNAYTNPGSCLRRPLLDKLVPHINDEYFQNQEGYFRQHFGVEHGFLDDGMIRSIIEQNGWLTTVAEPAVCAHIGFRLYNNAAPYLNRGTTIEEKIVDLKRVMALLESLPEGHMYRYLYDQPK